MASGFPYHNVEDLSHRPIDTHYCSANSSSDCSYYEAVGFKPWSTLTPLQANLLSTYMHDKLGIERPEEQFLTWADNYNDLAASFLALTDVMSHLQILFKDGTSALGTSLLQKVNGIEGDRVRIVVDSKLMKNWMDNGGKFIINRADGGKETGQQDFVDHTVAFAASLHKGYDVQWWSSVRKAPRIQINYRFGDSEADIDIDVAVWKWGFIPNPNHLTYAGSDSRQMYDDFVKKYGNPGFTVQLRTIKASGRFE